METQQVDKPVFEIIISLGALMVSLSKRVRICFANKNLELTPDQFALLDALYCCAEPLTQTDLVNLLDRDKTVVMRQTDTLEKRGFLARVVSPKDRRRKLLMLTPEGHNIHVQAQGLIEELLAELFGDVSPQALNDLLRGVKELQGKMKSPTE